MDYSAVKNLPSMFFEQAGRLGDKPFLWEKKDGTYQSVSYAEAAGTVKRLAAGLVAQGVKQGDRIVIVAENRPDWAIADLAVMAAGAVSVPAYVTNTEDDHRYILEHSEASALIVSTERLSKRALPAAAAAETCRFAVAIDPISSNPHAIDLFAWQELQGKGDAHPFDPVAHASQMSRDDTACFIYTSGTGGRPKGVMLTHKSILANCLGAYELLLELGLSDEVFLSLLPLSHSYEHTCGLMFPISIGAQIYYAEGPETLAQNLEEAKPTIMTAVPRLYEVLHDRIRRGVDRQGGLKAKLFHKAVDLGLKRYHQGSLGLGEAMLDGLLTKLVRKKVAQRFGGRLKGFVSGGAALNPDIGLFFHALGVTLLQGYGQTESSPVISANLPYNIKMHTVGPALKGVEVKIADDGEILVRGDLLMQGYWKDPETTAKTIVDGWLHTGDVGRIDEENYIQITDRKKDIIVNSGGDNISPARVEGKLTVESEIAQAMVVGDKRPYLVAVLVPSDEFVNEWAKANGKKADLAELHDDKDFVKALNTIVDKVNQDLTVIERVRRFIIAKEPFTTDNSQMTPTLKVRRHVVREAYQEALASLYGKG